MIEWCTKFHPDALTRLHLPTDFQSALISPPESFSLHCAPSVKMVVINIDGTATATAPPPPQGRRDGATSAPSTTAPPPQGRRGGATASAPSTTTTTATTAPAAESTDESDKTRVAKLSATNPDFTSVLHLVEGIRQSPSYDMFCDWINLPFELKIPGGERFEPYNETEIAYIDRTYSSLMLFCWDKLCRYDGLLSWLRNPKYTAILSKPYCAATDRADHEYYGKYHMYLLKKYCEPPHWRTAVPPTEEVDLLGT